MNQQKPVANGRDAAKEMARETFFFYNFVCTQACHSFQVVEEQPIQLLSNEFGKFIKTQINIPQIFLGVNFYS